MTLSAPSLATKPNWTRKGTHMKRIIGSILLVLALCISAAYAGPWIQIDDSGLDYHDTDLDAAYIGLSMEDTDLVVTIDDEPFTGALPAIKFEVPDLADREDFFGNEINATVGDISDVRWIGQNDDLPSAAYLLGFEVTHESTSLDDVLSAYERAFSDMGFSAQETETATPSVRLVTYSNGSASAVARFHVQRGDVFVSLQTN